MSAFAAPLFYINGFAIFLPMHHAGLKTLTATMETIFQHLNIKCVNIISNSSSSSYYVVVAVGPFWWPSSGPLLCHQPSPSRMRPI